MVQTNGRDPQLILLKTDDGKTDKIFAATVLPKGNAVAVAGATTLALFNPATAREIHKFIGHTGNVLCVTPSPDGRLFATGSSDQTIRIWHRDQEEPLLSIFVSGRDWIAWTPQGYYACSGQGERLIAWQIGMGANKVPVIHPAERFRASMYHPAMLKYVVPTGDLPRAMAMAQKYDKALIATTSVADVLPPEVVLDGFDQSEVKLDKDTLTVKASAKSAKHPITAMRLLVNGRPFLGTAGVKKFDSPQKDAEATWEVPLPPGTHTVAVIADSPVSKGMSKVGIVVRSGTIPKPNLYVLAMGVSEYAGKLKLNYCATDAQMLAKAFQEKSASTFAKIEVKVLTDGAATKKGILEGMDWLKSKLTPQDVGIVSFSGHGMRDPFGQFYLVPIDMDPKDDGRCGTAAVRQAVHGPAGQHARPAGRDPGRVPLRHRGGEGAPAGADGFPRPRPDRRGLRGDRDVRLRRPRVRDREQDHEGRVLHAGAGRGYGRARRRRRRRDRVHPRTRHLRNSPRVRQLSGGRQNPTLGRPTTLRPFPIARVGKPIAP